MTIEERVEFLHQSIGSHDRQIADLTDKVAGLTDKVDGLTNKLAVQAANIAIRTANIDKLVAVTNRDATAIRTLARLGRIA